MKIYISYFYQIRFFKPYMIPLSTALFDPKWYHSNGSKGTYIDKRGVINGLDISVLAPIMQDNGRCTGRNNCDNSPKNCMFLKNYEAQLNTTKFEHLITRLNDVGNYIKSVLQFDEEPVIVLIVYETPNNPCSERVALQKWFKEHGMELQELNPKEYSS